MISDEYFDYYTKYTEEYGERTCILMAVGSFYEMQSVHNETESIGNLETVAKLLNILVTKKNKSVATVDRSNPAFAGFPTHALPKFLPVLLENGYTVVIIDQDTNSDGNNKNGRKLRYVSGIYSPSIQPPNMSFDTSVDGNNITSILIELYKGSTRPMGIGYSIGNVNLTTNAFDVYDEGICHGGSHQLCESALDNISRIMMRYSNTQELLVTVVGEDSLPSQFYQQFLEEYLDINTAKVSVHWKHISKAMSTPTAIQNQTLAKIYSHVNFGLLQPMERFGLEQCQLGIENVLLLLEFIGKHDKKYVENMAEPKLIQEYNHLVLEMNTLRQLAVLPERGDAKANKCLFHILDKTRTVVGRRGLKRLLSKPYKNADTIRARLQVTKDIQTATAGRQRELEAILEGISDLERLHRRMTLNVLSPSEFVCLHNSYRKILELYMFLGTGLKDTTVQQLDMYIQKYSDTFDIEAMETNDNIVKIFKTGVFPELDEMSDKIKQYESLIEEIRIKYDGGKEFLKTSVSEAEGYFFVCTKIRVQILKQNLSNEENSDLIVKNNASGCRITTNELNDTSLQIANLQTCLNRRVKQHYIATLEELHAQFGDIFNHLTQFVVTTDIANSNLRCRTLYNYCEPEIVDGEESFVCAKGLRHPIIEVINHDTAYVPNDITLSSSKQGMLLYALNSCGKSSLLRSIGLSVLMAQCGLYVPCSGFQISPFSCIVTQVDLYDNLWKAQSSFVTEMVGLRKILTIADKKCLVLSDELTKGTEVVSATSIFASAALELVNRKCKFVFTTHLQDVAKIPSVQQNESIQICHLSVDVQEDGEIVFERVLKPGPCSELYGLEVARAVGLNKSFLESAFGIRNDLLNVKGISLAKKKRSRYNAKKTVDACEVCDYSPRKATDIPLDTHHIKFQCTADADGFVGSGIHKHAKHNLVCLCKPCHIAVHSGELVINGYIQTTAGVRLDFEKNKNIEK
jgi:DNA mismatch repair protein MutS